MTSYFLSLSETKSGPGKNKLIATREGRLLMTRHFSYYYHCFLDSEAEIKVLYKYDFSRFFSRPTLIVGREIHIGRIREEGGTRRDP